MSFSSAKLAHFLMALSVAAILGSCGGGGGSSSSSTPTNSTKAVINQSGGQVTLNDGTSVTFAAGIVKDGTAVTVTSTAQPNAVPSQEVQALSPTVVIDMAPNSVLASAPVGSEITIEIPVTENTVQTGLSAVSAKASVVSTVKNIVQLVLQDPVGQFQTAKQITTYYAPLILKSPGKGIVSIGINKLCNTALGGRVCTVGKLIVGAKNSVQCTQQNTSLFQVDFLNGKPNFTTNIRRNGKPPLILVHGWQELGIIGMSCDKPYSTTWQKFLNEYAIDPAIFNKFQVFSLAYSSSNPVQGDLGIGNEFAQIIKNQFGSEAVYIVAHSMGGVVARTALVNYGANIRGLVTLATPHHGTPAASQEGIALFGNTPLYPIFDYVIGGEGIKDLAWDNFDGFLPPFNDRRGNPGNPFLKKLNADDIYQGRYVVFAAVDNEPTIGSILKSMGYENDLVVPDISALLYSSASVPDSRIRLQKRFNGLLHLNLVGNGITDSVGVLFETRAALLGLLNDANLPAIPTDTTPPSIPTGLTATALSSSQINLTWSASTDNVSVAGYKIYRGVLLATTATLAYSDSGLSPSTQYCYTVSAFDAVGNESGPSIQQCATTQATTVIDTINPTVIAFSVTPVSLNLGNPFIINYTISDSGGSGLWQAQLWRAPDASGSPGTWAKITTTSLSGNGPVSGTFTDTPTLAGTYWYGMHGVDNAINIGPEPSPIQVVVNSATVVLQGVTPVLSSIFPSTIPPGTSYQYVEFSGSDFTASSWPQFSIDGGNSWYWATSAPSFNISNKLPNDWGARLFDATWMKVAVNNTFLQTIYWRVCASQGSNSCSTNQPVTVHVSSSTSPIVQDLAATMITSTSAQLNGTINSNGLGTISYLEFGTSTDYETISNLIGPYSSNFNVWANWSGLLPNTTYHYRVVANNSGGTTIGSDVIFTTLP